MADTAHADELQTLELAILDAVQHGGPGDADAILKAVKADPDILRKLLEEATAPAPSGPEVTKSLSEPVPETTGEALLGRLLRMGEGFANALRSQELATRKMSEALTQLIEAKAAEPAPAPPPAPAPVPPPAAKKPRRLTITHSDGTTATIVEE